MDVATLVLEQPVPDALGDEFARRLFFVSAEVSGFELVRADGQIREVRLLLDRPTDPAELSRKLNTMVATDVLTQRRPRASVCWCSARQDRPAGPVFADLAARGIAYQVGEGQVALAEPMLTLIERLDALLQDMAVTEFDAQRMRYPALLPTASLHRAGYLTSFPQHAMFATRLPADLDVYREFLAGAQRGEPVAELAPRLCHTADLCLPPTMCYHTFLQFAGELLPAPAAVTARGRSFRFEGRYEADLERLWDFTIREVVFIGEHPQVSECRRRFLQRATRLLDDLGLAGYAEAANDPFFGSQGTGEAVSAQLMLERKHELRLYVSPERSIAVASFNLHGDVFTEAFDIRLAGAGAASACVGFGLERLAYAVACQHGLSERDWPPLLRARGRAE